MLTKPFPHREQPGGKCQLKIQALIFKRMLIYTEQRSPKRMTVIWRGENVEDAVTKSNIFRGLSWADCSPEKCKKLENYQRLLTRQKIKKGCRCNSVPHAIRKVHFKVFCWCVQWILNWANLSHLIVICTLVYKWFLACCRFILHTENGSVWMNLFTIAAEQM